MEQISLGRFQEEAKKQGVPREHIAFICPACGLVQSANDLIRAGAGKDFDAVWQYLGFSCVGRFTGAGAPDFHSGRGCDWTLGGLLRIHEVEIVTPDGKIHPMFRLATSKQAVDHMHGR